MKLERVPQDILHNFLSLQRSGFRTDIICGLSVLQLHLFADAKHVPLVVSSFGRTCQSWSKKCMHHLCEGGAVRIRQDLQCILQIGFVHLQLSWQQARLQQFSCRRSLPRKSEEHTSELQSLMRNSYAVFCLKKKKRSTKRKK